MDRSAREIEPKLAWDRSSPENRAAFADEFLSTMARIRDRLEPRRGGSADGPTSRGCGRVTAVSARLPDDRPSRECGSRSARRRCSGARAVGAAHDPIARAHPSDRVSAAGVPLPWHRGAVGERHGWVLAVSGADARIHAGCASSRGRLDRNLVPVPSCAASYCRPRCSKATAQRAMRGVDGRRIAGVTHPQGDRWQARASPAPAPDDPPQGRER